MSELSMGTIVRLANNLYCTVQKELGRGGQGIVYQVDYQGKPFALKWYLANPGQAFYTNLCKNAQRGAPSNHFIWPLLVTREYNGSFGYLMELRPQGFADMSQFLLLKKQFKTVEAQLNACLQICEAFKRLHANGYSYQDLNDGNFFINGDTGDVLICDNDNVTSDKNNLGIIGKVGYLAPEIVESQCVPNKYTDYYSLAVCLFILIYMNRPFEGAKYLSCPCDNNPAFATKLYGYESVFIMDPTDTSNRPVRGIHKNVIRRWTIYPEILRQAFCKTFSKEAQKDQTKRLMESDWIKIILQVRNLLVKCPECGNPTFVGPSGSEPCVCAWCKKTPAISKYLKINGYNIPLTHGQKLYAVQTSDKKDFKEIAGETISKGGEIGLVNRSNESWSVSLPSGNKNLVAPGASMPARDGFRILFGNQGNEGVING